MCFHVQSDTGAQLLRRVLKRPVKECTRDSPHTWKLNYAGLVNNSLQKSGAGKKKERRVKICVHPLRKGGIDAFYPMPQNCLLGSEHLHSLVKTKTKGILTERINRCKYLNGCCWHGSKGWGYSLQRLS